MRLASWGGRRRWHHGASGVIWQTLVSPAGATVSGFSGVRGGGKGACAGDSGGHTDDAHAAMEPRTLTRPNVLQKVMA